MRAAMAAIPYPIAFGGATGDGAANQFNKDDIDFVDYHATMERMRRASDAYDFKQDRHTGKLQGSEDPFFLQKWTSYLSFHDKTFPFFRPLAYLSSK